jgi:hypothetical protein
LQLRTQDISQAQDTRDYQLRLKEFQAQQATTRAGITGPNAPTAQGRKTYWDTIAEQRTKLDPLGRVWVGTPRGITFAKDTTGRPMRSSDWIRDQRDVIIATGLDPVTGRLTPTAQKKLAGLGIMTGGGVEKPIKQPTTQPVKLQHYRGADGKMYAFNPVTGQTSAIPGGAPPKANLPKVDLKVSQNLGKWVDSSGSPIPGLNKPGVPPPKPTGTTRPGGKGKLTPGQLDTMVRQWHTGAIARQNVGTAALPNWQDVPTGQGKIGYQQAYSNLRNRGYNDLEARAALDVYWKRGEAGRPWLPGTARTTLTKANLRPTPRFHPYTGKDAKTGKPYTAAIPYLTPAQVKALKAAGQLPPGEWADRPPEGHVWVIRSQ